MKHKIFKRFAALGLSAVITLGAAGSALASEQYINLGESKPQEVQNILEYASDNSRSVPSLSSVKPNYDTKIGLIKGQSQRLTVAKKSVKWSSSKSSVASVSSKGKVTAKKAGKAVITARAGTKKYKYYIVVTNDISAVQPVLDMKNTSEQTLTISYSDKLTASDIHYQVSDERIAAISGTPSVDEKNRKITLTVSAKNNGTADIKITSDKTNEVISCKLYVTCIENKGEAALKKYISENGVTLKQLIDENEDTIKNNIGSAFGNKISYDDYIEFITELSKQTGDVRFILNKSDSRTDMIAYSPKTKKAEEAVVFLYASNDGKDMCVLASDDLSDYNASYVTAHAADKKNMFMSYSSVYRPDYSAGSDSSFDCDKLTASGFSKSNIKKQSKEIIDTAMYGWNDIIKNAGTSFSELGFLSYQ